MTTIRPLKPCAYPGCKAFAIQSSGYCKVHAEIKAKQKAIADRNRGTRTERGYSNRWLKASATYLAQHPLCVECLKQGITKPATEVDHIIPHKGNSQLFWDTNNWQSLCHECHSRKTVREDGGFGHKITSKRTKKRLI